MRIVQSKFSLKKLKGLRERNQFLLSWNQVNSLAMFHRGISSVGYVNDFFCRLYSLTQRLFFRQSPTFILRSFSVISRSYCSASSLNAYGFSRATDLYSLNKKISSLIRLGRLLDARSVFDCMKERNTVTWNSMLSGYVKKREITRARKLFDEIPERDIVSWNLMISGYISCGGIKYIEAGRRLFDQMPKRDCVTWNTMISGYARNGMMDLAIDIFNSMPQKNVISWNAMISGFLQNGNVGRAIEFFQRMPERDSVSLSALVSGLIQNDELDEAARILLQIARMNDGKEDLIHAYNTLIAGYGQKGMVKEAQRLFNEIPSNKEDVGNFQRNIISWNSMIMGYVKVGDIHSARELFNQMTEWDAFSWNTMISGYVQKLEMKEAVKLFDEMPNPDTPTWNMMISGFAETDCLDLAHVFFRRMSQRSTISWNSMIAAYEKNKDYKNAVELFMEMQNEGEKPDRHTLSSVLSVCTGLVDLFLGMQIHQLITKEFIADKPINNALITMYSKCGAIMEARVVFDETRLQKDVISWNAMIGGYASHGYASESLELFRLMKQYKVEPTYITFISVLNACAHAGLVEEGQKQFKSMINEYSIEPRVEHFASLVDILGRHGQLEEVLNLINRMPCEPDKTVWGALLSASRIHDNVDIARIAAEALMRLESESSAPYVLLYNMYADAGNWNKAEEVRAMMEMNNVRKQPGYSWVDSSNG